MAALVQTYPQQTSTVSMLQARTVSNSSMVPPQSQTSQQYAGVQHKNNCHPAAGGLSNLAPFRGAPAPTHPYSVPAAPNSNSFGQWQTLSAPRASSSSSVPTMPSLDPNSGSGRPRHSANASMPNLPNSAMNFASAGSRDDSILHGSGTRRVSPATRPQSVLLPNSTNLLPLWPMTPAKSQPDRYRRSAVQRSLDASAAQISAPPTISPMFPGGHIHLSPSASRERRPSTLISTGPNTVYANIPGTVDDMQLHKLQQDSKKFRRRSMPALDAMDLPKSLNTADPRRRQDLSAERSATRLVTEKDNFRTARLVTIGRKNGSSESLISTQSSNSRPSSSAQRNNAPTSTGKLAQVSEPSDEVPSNSDYPKLIIVPPRSSSSDAAKRAANSPLSKPVQGDAKEEARVSKDSLPGGSRPEAPAATGLSTVGASSESPAVKQLAAINQKGGKLKSKTSRLRRALSFGSAGELRRAGGAVEPKDNSESRETTTARKTQPSDELDAAQARIAERQEAAGIGSSIYAGSRLFTGSSDNVSISSTASSASIMIRKMGRGMKKGGRSLAGLFRPKAENGPINAEIPDASQAAVSMVTVEAERERVNVNLDSDAGKGGGTGFLRLERNSVDANNGSEDVIRERAGSSETDNSNSRKSIVGGDRERAEVLAAVRKGILKHSNGYSTPSPRLERDALYDLPAIPHVADSPTSSAPSTPNDDANHNRGGSVSIGNEDYFMTALRLRHDTRSAPGTPQGQSKRNATFSPRIIFHDTWPSQEYDRRSEIATCNRLTPMLAQQIKEELNNFKMEMEVHESSKIYTHFF